MHECHMKLLCNNTVKEMITEFSKCQKNKSGIVYISLLNESKTDQQVVDEYFKWLTKKILLGNVKVLIKELHAV